MKIRKFKSIALALSLLLLAGCSAGQTPSPSPSPIEAPPPVESPTPTTGAASVPEGLTAEEELLHYLDIVLNSGSPCLQTHRIGLTVMEMTGYEEAIRELFTSREWARAEAPDGPGRESSPSVWSFLLYGSNYEGDDFYITAATDSDELSIRFVSKEGNYSLDYTGENVSALPGELTALWSGPNFLYGAVELPGDVPAPNLPEAYAEAFQAMYLASGAITEFKLESVTRETTEKAASLGIECLSIAYAVKPADPEEPCWQSQTASEDGWYTFSRDLIPLERDKDGVWRTTYY